MFQCFSPSLFTEKINITKAPRYNTLLIFADSLGVRFSGSLPRNPLCRTLFQKHKNIYTWTYVRHKFFMEAWERSSYDNKGFNEILFLRGISDAILADKDMQYKKSVVIFSFGLHILKFLSLKKAQNLFEKFLQTLQQIKKLLEPSSRWLFGKQQPLLLHLWETSIYDSSLWRSVFLDFQIFLHPLLYQFVA